MPMIWAGNGGRLHQGGSREGGKKWSGSGNIPTDRRHERMVGRERERREREESARWRRLRTTRGEGVGWPKGLS